MGVGELLPIFGSKTKVQEILCLLYDAKDVVRQGFYSSELQKVKEFCSANKLFIVESPFKVVLADGNRFSNKGIRLDLDNPRLGMVFVYISKDEIKAHEGLLYETLHDDQRLGLLLGYPSCCVEYFISHFSAANPNPQIVSSNPFTNISQREQDCVLISHFPCSADCQESIALGKKYLEILKNVDQDRAKEIFDVLQESSFIH
ncbi:MAG TPA: DUF483 domain-containing protein [Candidatus Nanoarchaeia archaeon]|nr:DUF483 domain-containing protein [Candidatus Nanoarchaeia archaeon]